MMQPPAFHPNHQTSERDEGLSRAIQFSLLLHAALLSALFLKNTFFPSHSTPYVPTLRVDIIGLPDLLKKDMDQIGKHKKAVKAEDKTKEVEVTPKEMSKPGEMVLNPEIKKEAKRKEKIKNALARIKALNKFRSNDSSQEVPKLIKGNQISHGNSLTGEAKENANSAYYDAIHDKLHGNWELPLWLSKQNLSAQVIISIDSFGNVSGMQFTKPSGSPQFDEAVKRAIAKSQPFPPPPENMRNTLNSNGVLLGFPL